MDKASAFSGLKRDFIDDTGTGEPYVSAGYAAPASGGLRLGGVEVAPAEAQTGRSGQMASGGAAQRPVPVAQRGDRRQTQVVQLDDALFLGGARRVGRRRVGTAALVAELLLAPPLGPPIAEPHLFSFPVAGYVSFSLSLFLQA